MKRVILCLLVAVQLLIGGAAMAERLLVELEINTGPGYKQIGGMGYLSSAMIEGRYNFEGRVVLQNKSKENVTFCDSVLYIMHHGVEVARITPSRVSPASTGPDGFALLTYSAMDILMPDLKDIQTVMTRNKACLEYERQMFVGTKYGTVERSEYSDALRLKLDIAEIDKGVFTVILVALDDSGQMLWAEDVIVDRGEEPAAYVDLEGYELKLFEENGLAPDIIYGIVHMNLY